MNQPISLIVDSPPESKGVRKASRHSASESLHAAGIPLQSNHVAEAKNAGAIDRKTASDLRSGSLEIVKTLVPDTEINPWDLAHAAAKSSDGAYRVFVEPDFLQEVTVNGAGMPVRKNGNIAVAKGRSKDTDTGYDPDWMPNQNIVWHLRDDFSELKSAREAVSGIDYNVRIGHIDTGYTDHFAIPKAIRTNKLQRNFIDGENRSKALDPGLEGLIRMPFHGTGTLGVLAGGFVDLKTDDGSFNDLLGGAPDAEIICCRISPSVVLLKTSAFAEALNYLTDLTLNGTPVHVVSMSMGGAPSRAWANAVNNAYDAGITLVTAAGNNFNGLPTQHVIYPARFGRVIAACGATYENMPYSSGKLGEMEGCFGPRRFMKYALAAYTPNIPWASGKHGNINFSGAGTSCATPQIAAAAAHYYRKNHKELDTLQPWQRVEAIRHALFSSASKTVGDGGDFRECFGNGILRAAKALEIPLKVIKHPVPADSVPFFPILATLFKSKSSKLPVEIEMYNTEIAQLVYEHKRLASIIDDDERDYSRVSVKKWRLFREALITEPDASASLKEFLSKHT